MRRWVSSFSKTHLSTLSLSQLNSLLQNCSNSRSLQQAKQVHQQIILNGFNYNNYMATKLVQIYADRNDLVNARQIFDKMPQRNVFTWTAILAFYSRNGGYADCLQTYKEMREEGVRPDRYVFPKVIRACGQLLLLEAGIQIHGDIIKFCTESTSQVSNSLIDMYSKYGDIEKAQQVFYEMTARDLLSWNSMISGYVGNGFLDLALRLFGLMKLEGFEPDLITWNTVMDAYCRMGHCKEASEIFNQITEPNIISWTTLILGYSKMGKHEMALGTFGEMIRRGAVRPDSDILSCVLSSCRYLEALRNGQEIHGYGIKMSAGVGFYDSAGAALLTMYGRCKRIRDAGNVFGMMDKCDVVTWNSTILSFSLLGMEDAALKYFVNMQSRGVKADHVTISTILPVCDLNSGRQIHAYIKKNSFGLSISVMNSLINMYSKCGCIGPAYSVFLRMVTRDLVTWNTMIAGFGMHGQGLDALRVFQEMKVSGVQPNSVTFTSVLSACSHSGLIDEGLDIFYSLTRDFGLVPTMEHFACVVDSLTRAGKLKDAVDFISKLPIEPDANVWGSLLGASRAYQNFEFGNLAAENLFRLEPDNSGNYVTLSNIYARGGRWDDALRVRKAMESRGLMKPSGYSWIETDN